jgi:hypothetical protein
MIRLDFLADSAAKEKDFFMDKTGVLTPGEPIKGKISGMGAYFGF